MLPIPPASPATGADLADHRRTHGLTQRQLGDRLGIGQATVSKLESRRHAALPEAVAARFVEVVGAART